MNKKIIENNILIAEFLGGEIVLWEAKDRLGDDIENDTYYVYFPGLFGGISVEDLNYHEDWNSLMEICISIGMEFVTTNKEQLIQQIYDKLRSMETNS
jgi:hypothetical protein